MKYISIAFLFFMSAVIALPVKAQDFTIPQLPSNKEEFVKSEPDFIRATNWLENTMITSDTKNRKLVNAYVTAWVINSPTVTVEMRSSILKAFDKNAELLPVFLGGYSRYCLQNNYSKDQLKCNVAGLKAVINCYNLGGDLKKDKAILKVIIKNNEGQLEEWVKDAMK